jgi:hypothetical protein
MAAGRRGVIKVAERLEKDWRKIGERLEKDWRKDLLR